MERYSNRPKENVKSFIAPISVRMNGGTKDIKRSAARLHTHLSAMVVVKHSKVMATQKENTARIVAISIIDSRRQKMDNFNNEKNYYASLAIIKNLLKQGLITREEFVSIRHKLIEKYNPILCRVFCDNDLTL